MSRHGERTVEDVEKALNSRVKKPLKYYSGSAHVDVFSLPINYKVFF